jgi:DNA-binding Lrp family transcriptional regulator
MKPALDLADQKILFELDINSRSSASNIARVLKIPKETANYRIKRLEKSGWLDQLYTLIDASQLGYSSYRITITLTKLSAASEARVVEFITTHPSCANLRITEGSYDLVFITFQKTLNDLRQFLQTFHHHFGSFIAKRNVHLMVKTIKLNQKFFLEGRTVKKEFTSFRVAEQTLDSIDLGILKAITKNARTKLSDIAPDVGVDSRLVDYHLKKLERSGIIVQYTTALNLERLDREMVQVDIALKEPKNAGRIIDFFGSTRTCIFAYELLGTFDLSVELYVKDDEDLRTILTRFKHRFMESYLYYDILRVYRKYVINWSPFHV